MKKEHTGYVLVERTQKGMLFFQDAKRKRTYRMNKKSKKKSAVVWYRSGYCIWAVTDCRWRNSHFI